MPTTNDSRAIKINANNPAKVVEFDVGYSATFDSELASRYEYTESSTASVDLTIREFLFRGATGSEVARVSIRVQVRPSDVAAGITTSARGSSTTPRSTGSGQELRSFEARTLREWSQPVINAAGGGTALRDVAVVDVRSTAPGGSASHTVRTDDDGGFTLAVSITAPGGAVTGTVTLGTTPSAGAGFTLGPVTISTSDGAGATRR